MKTIRLFMVLVSTFIALLSGRADYLEFDPKTTNSYLMPGKATRYNQVNLIKMGRGLGKNSLGAPSQVTLPIGSKSKIQEGLAIQTTDITVNLYQIYPDDSEQLLMGGTANSISFQSYADLVRYLKEALRSVEKGFGSQNYNPSLPVTLFVGCVYDKKVEPFGGAFTFYKFSQFVEAGFPSGYVDTFEPEIENYPTIILPKLVAEARMITLDRVDHHVISDWDTRKDPSEYKDLWIQYSYGMLMIKRDFCIEAGASGPWEMVLQVWYRDGTTEAWDGDGNPTEIPTPHLEIHKPGEVVLKYGKAGSRDVFKIQSSPDMENWNTVTNISGISKPYIVILTPTNNGNAFFRMLSP